MEAFDSGENINLASYITPYFDETRAFFLQ